MLGVESTKRDLVGRWKPDASDTYVRSYNGLVAQLQAQYGKALRKPNRFRLLDEVDIAESADAWLRPRKTEVADEERDELVTAVMTSMDSFAANDINYVHEDSLDVHEDTEMVEETLNEEDKGENKTHRDSGFIVVTTAKNCKRLHKASGGCWMAREKIFKHAVEFQDRPSEAEYTHVCRICWPKERCEEDSSGETSSDTDSSSSSSGSDS
eukprot:s4203_g3.t1